MYLEEHDVQEAKRMVIDFHIRFPEKSCSSFSKSKPKAELVIETQQGSEYTIKYPVAAAKQFNKEYPALPCECESFFNMLRQVESKVCESTMLKMLDRRDYTQLEMQQKLRLNGFLPEVYEPIIDRAITNKYICDERYAKYFIDAKKRSGWGQKKIELELKHRGIDAYALKDYPQAYFDNDEEYERTLSILRRKHIPDTRAYEKLMRHLLSKGFNSSVASSCVKAYLQDAEEI